MTQDTDTEFDEPEAPESGNAKLRRELKEANRRAQEAEERAEANVSAARRLAFQDAGLADSGPAAFFREHYTGPLDADSIKASASQHGFMAAQEAATEAEVQQIDGMAKAAQGAESPERAGSMEAMDREMREAAENTARNNGDVGAAIAAVQRRYDRPTTLDSL